MSQSLFESDFKAVSDKEWIEKIEKDLRGAPFDSLKWKWDDGSEIEPFYTSSRNTSLDDKIHREILSQLKNKDWLIIQDLRNCSRDEIQKSLASDVDKIILERDQSSENNPRFEFITHSESSLKSNEDKTLDYQSYIDDFTPWLSAKSKAVNFQYITPNIFVNGSYFHNSGASDQYELSLTLSLLNEYLHQLKSAGKEKGHFIVEMGVGINFYLSIAKFRSARILIQNLIDLYDLKISFDLRARTSEYLNSHLDQYSNLLRHTTMALSAILGSVDGLIVNPFQEANSRSLRLARNIQHLLKNESYLDKVSDMMAGSYLIEELTQLFNTKCWREFKDIEDEGGFIVLNKAGKIKEKLLQQHQNRVSELKDGKVVMIGVNKYQQDSDDAATKIKSEVFSEPWQFNNQLLSNEF